MTRKTSNPARQSKPEAPAKDKPPRSLNNRPEDPNRIGADRSVPPGVESEDLWDPGSRTPGAPKVDNRS
ncbi:MAG: hypothetical protein AB7E55_25535 [Pigmentiphaga sp.]